MIPSRLMLVTALSLVIASSAHAQGTQCQTDPVGSRSSKCASEQFVTDSIAAAPQGTVKEVDTTGLASGGPITSTGTVTVTAASKSDQQAASSAVLAVTPSQQQSHPSAAKAWASITGSTGAALVSYNGTTARSSAGVYTLTFATAFASVDYACVTTAKSNSALLVTQITAQTASIASFQSSTPAGVLTDPTTIEIVCFGGQ